MGGLAGDLRGLIAGSTKQTLAIKPDYAALMRSKLTFCILALAMAIAAVAWTRSLGRAAPSDNATFIVDQNIESRNYDDAWETLSTQVVSSLSEAMDGFGARIVDHERFIEAFLGGFRATLEEELSNQREEVIAAYTRLLTEDELADLAAFYRSSEGQTFLREASASGSSPEQTLAFFQGPGRPILEHREALLIHLEAYASAIEAPLLETFAMEHLADIMAEPDIVAFEDEGLRARVVAKMRASGD